MGMGCTSYGIAEEVNLGRFRGMEYLIFWKGYSAHEMTWEPD